MPTQPVHSYSLGAKFSFLWENQIANGCSVIMDEIWTGISVSIQPHIVRVGWLMSVPVAACLRAMESHGKLKHTFPCVSIYVPLYNIPRYLPGPSVWLSFLFLSSLTELLQNCHCAK